MWTWTLFMLLWRWETVLSWRTNPWQWDVWACWSVSILKQIIFFSYLGWADYAKNIKCLMSLFTSQTTSNYHARKYGVRAAMPGFIAKKLCPNLVIVPTNFDKYRAVSSEVRWWKNTEIKDPDTAEDIARFYFLTDMNWFLLDPWDFFRLWPQFYANEPGWSLPGFHRTSGKEAELARVLTYASLSCQQHHYRQELFSSQECDGYLLALVYVFFNDLLCGFVICNLMHACMF